MDTLVHKADPYSLFKTITFGNGAMPQQQRLTPSQRYEVVHYIREAFLKESNPSQYVKVDDAYLGQLPVPDGKVVKETPAQRLNVGPVLCSNLGQANQQNMDINLENGGGTTKVPG